MENNLAGVADVRRWVRAGTWAKRGTAARADDARRGESDDVAYEAPDPWLQSRPWVDSQRADAVNLK